MNTNRQIIILEKLTKDNSCTIKQLSLLCDVSYKTIQNDIKDLNYEIIKNNYVMRLVTQRGMGVQIEDVKNDEIEFLINSLKMKGTEITNYDKEFYTLLCLFKLFCNNYLKIDELSDELLLSRSSVNELLSNVKKMMLKWDIKVKARPYYGLYVEGLERDIRRCMFEMLVHKHEHEVDQLLGIDISMFFSFRENVVAIIRNFDVSINDTILEQLLLYIEVMTIRIKNGKILNQEEFNLDRISFEYILSEKISYIVEDYTNKRISSSEVDWICRFVIGKCLKKTENDSQVNYEISLKILPDVIEMIKNNYGYDFTQDIDLFTSMSIHLNALCKRAKISNYLINPMLDNIKTYSLLAYDIATDVSLLINKVLDVNLPDDEISFFAIYLHLAIERKRQRIIPRKALVVCPSGKGMSELTANYVRKQFGEYISELKVCGYYDLETIDYSRYDYIFTMTPLKVNVPLPVIEFSLNADRYRLGKTKLQILGKKISNFPLAALTPPTLFFNNIKAKDKTDALTKIIKNIKSVIKLNDNFYDSVNQREKIVSTELDNGFAIPHPLDKDAADQSFFSVSILNNPIVWDKKKIRIVLLTYIKGDMDELDLFYDVFAHIVTNKEYQMSLIDKPTYENFVDIVNEISAEVRKY